LRWRQCAWRAPLGVEGRAWNQAPVRVRLDPQQSREKAEFEHDPEKWVPVFRKDHAQNEEV
jgi:hypothetical protein